MPQAPWIALDATVDDGVTLSEKLNASMPALYSNHAGNAIPLDPKQGQIWVDTAATPVLTIKQYDGAAWRDLWTVNVSTGALGGPFAGGSGGGASVTISDLPPATPSVGDLWFDSVRLNTFVYYEDANSSQWVQIVPAFSGLTQAAGDQRYIQKTGGTMTGGLALAAGEPSAPTMAVPQSYVDAGDKWVQIDSVAMAGKQLIDINWTAGEFRAVQLITAGAQPTANSTGLVYLQVARGGTVLAGATDYAYTGVQANASLAGLAASSNAFLIHGAGVAAGKLVKAKIDVTQDSDGNGTRTIGYSSVGYSVTTGGVAYSTMTNGELIAAGTGLLSGIRFGIGTTQWAAGRLIALGLRS